MSMRWLLLLMVLVVLGIAGRDERRDREFEAQQTREIMTLAQQWDIRP